MATRLPEPLPEEKVSRTPVAKLRQEYVRILKPYSAIITQRTLFCHKCGNFYPVANYYQNRSFASGYFPICTDCLLDMATDFDKSGNKHIDNKEKAKATAQFMDIPFLEKVYDEAIVALKSAESLRVRTAWQQMIMTITLTPEYMGKHWKDSQFTGDEYVRDPSVEVKARPQIKELFGEGFSETDYVYLQNQYDDWKARTSVDSKSQETYIVRICFKLLDIWKAQKNGKDTKELDKSLNELMAAANLQPKQNVANAATDSLTFGQLIEKWELEKPIPEPDEEFKDVNNIGRLVKVYFAGHLAKALGLRNAISEEYDQEMAKYTVKKPQAAEDVKSGVYQDIFGSES